MRLPAVAGRFYPADPDDLRDMIGWCFSHPLGPGKPGDVGSDRRISGIMAPRAGYVCSGMTAAHAYRALKEDGLPDLYVIIGPDHYGTAMGRTVICSEDFSTPLGVCRSDREVCSRLSEVFADDPRAHAREHAVEVQVPFIQYIDPDPSIVAVTMGDQSPRAAAELASVLREACSDRDAVVIASTDMSHYIPKEEAERLGAAPNPVGAESKYEFVPMFYRVSGTFRKADPTLEGRMIRINPMRSGADTIMRVLQESIRRATGVSGQDR